MQSGRKWRSLFIAMCFALATATVPVSRGLAASAVGGVAIQQKKKPVAVKSVRDTVKRVEKRVEKRLPARERRGTVPKGAGDPDLMAEVVSATPAGTNQVRIVGRITNVGGGEYVSGPGPTEAWIQLELAGRSGPDAYPVVHSVPIVRMRAGQVLNISTTVAIDDHIADFLRWGTAPAGSNECAATLRMNFLVLVSYDPDLHDDGNEQNNDDDHGNDLDRMQAPASRFGYLADCPG